MTTIEEVREAARRLPPIEQFQLIQELLRELEHRYQQPGDVIPPGVRSAAGQPISPQDSWVAATALRYRLPLVTHNPDDFQQISA